MRYLAYVYLLGLTLLTFVPTASADFACHVDSGGANDLSGSAQADLTQMCYDFDPLPSSYLVSVSFDKVNFSGNNTGDGCMLFDTDGDPSGFIDYAICVQVGGQPAILLPTTPFAYICTSPDSEERCGGATLFALTGTTCSSEISNDDPFPSGEAHPQDTKITCDVSTLDVPAGGIQVNACSYPSASPTSDPKDCLRDSDKGQLILRKDAGTDTATTFTFNSNSPGTSRSDIITGSGQLYLQLDPGSYTIDELTPDNWAVTDIQCVDRNNASVGTANLADGSVSSLNITKTERLICDFVNRQEADISVTKTDGNTGYTPKGTSVYTITVANDGNSNLSGVSFEDTVPNGLTITNISCSAGATCNLTQSGNTVSGLLDIPKNSSVTVSIEVEFSINPQDYQ